MVRRGARGDRGRGHGLRYRHGLDDRARPGRARLAESDRAAHRSVGPKRRLWRLGCPLAPVCGPRRRPRVLLQRRRGPSRPLPRLRRGARARGGAPRGRLCRRVRHAAGGRVRRSGRAHDRGDQGDSRALPRPRGRLGARERTRCRSRPEGSRRQHLRAGRRRLAAHDGVRRRQGSRARTGGRAAYLPGGGRGSHSVEVRPRLRAAHLRSGRRPPRVHLAPQGSRRRIRPRSGVRRGAHLPARTRDGGGRGPPDVDSPGRRRTRTPSTTSSTRTRGSRASSERPARPSGRPSRPTSSRPRSATS